MFLVLTVLSDRHFVLFIHKFRRVEPKIQRFLYPQLNELVPTLSIYSLKGDIFHIKSFDCILDDHYLFIQIFLLDLLVI